MKALSRLLLCFAFFLIAAATAKSGDIYKINPAQSSITFSIHQFLGVTHGKFSQFSGTIEIDRARPEQSSVEAVIAVKSIDTGIAKRDEHLRSQALFDAENYPQITFKSRSVKQTGPQTGDILGDLTIHGATRPITLHVKLLSPSTPGADISSTRWVVVPDPIKRSNFGLLFSKGAEAISGIGQEVTVQINVEATR